MTVQCFAQWCETASSLERVRAAEIICSTINDPHVSAEEAEVAKSVLVVILNDPAPKVRMTLARGLGRTSNISRGVLLSLCDAGDAIACLIAGQSPVLGDADLIDLVAGGSVGLRGAIARRPLVSVRVCAAVAEIADAAICVDLLSNEGAAIAGLTYRRLAERLGDDANVRGALMGRPDLPIGVRQTLILKTGEALSKLSILINLVGDDRADHVTFDACERATAELADLIDENEGMALIEHLRLSGQLNVAFLLRTLCSGHIDLLTLALARLSGVSERRVRLVLFDGRRRALMALLGQCGLPNASSLLFESGIAVWREIASGRLDAGADEVPQLIMERIAAHPAVKFDAGRAGEFEAIMRFLHRLSGDQARATLRTGPLRLAA